MFTGAIRQATLATMLAALALVANGSGLRAQPATSPLLHQGDVVVSGFSGTVAPDPALPLPPGKSPIDLTFIDVNGRAARILDATQAGTPWDAHVVSPAPVLDISAHDVGQVFGIALDDEKSPNVYLTATSAFGLNIVVPGSAGAPPERSRIGQPGAVWMNGQFGLDRQGGPGSIWKVDGTTGEASLFANVTLDGASNPGPALGSIAYDPVHRQLFVSDLYTGMIHRFDLDGTDLGHFDQGVAGRSAAGLAPVGFDPAGRLDIASAAFNSEDPGTWGYAPPERRVWGLAVHDGRLFYAVADGPQVWSVGIAADGSFANDPRWELDVPADLGAFPVSDMTFARSGAMILAERATVTASYDYSAFTVAAEPRVLVYWLENPDDPATPSRWMPVPEEYAVGFPNNSRQTNGGVDLGYAYGSDGRLDTQACEGALWTTGEKLRNDPALASQLLPGGPLLIDGLQASPADQVRNANTPPWQSYYVDYDGKFDDAPAIGHVGTVRILKAPCAGEIVAGGYGGPPYVANPPYVVGVACLGPNCSPPCPAGTNPDGSCPHPTPIDIAIEKTGATSPPLNVPWYSFTLTVTNIGAGFNGSGIVTATDVVPAGMTFTSVTATNAGDWTCPTAPTTIPATAGMTVTCSYIGAGPTAPGQILGTIKFIAMATGTGPFGPFTNCATTDVGANSGFVDADPADNKDCVTVTKPLDVAIEKVGTAAAGSPGSPPGTSDVYFQLLVTNVGGTFAGSGAITVSDNPQPGVTFTSVAATAASDWNCAIVSGSVACTYIGSGPAAPGASLGSITIAGTATGAGPWDNCASVQLAPAAGIDANPSNNNSCTTAIVSAVDVSLVKTYAPGPSDGSGAFTFTVKNEGSVIPAGTVIAVDDPLPAGITITGFGGTSAADWSCTPPFAVTGPATLSCTYLGTAPFSTGATLPDLLLTSTLAPGTGTISNCGTVSLTDGGTAVTETNAANNTACVTVANPGSGPSGVSVTKTCGTATPIPNGNGVLAADCQITVTATGSPLPATITIDEQLNGPSNVPGHDNEIVSMTSAESWACPAMPVAVALSAPCQLPGADLTAAGGQSVIDVVVHLSDAGNAWESQNCVSAAGLDGAGATVATAPQVCATFNICPDGSQPVAGACPTSSVAPVQAVDLAIAKTGTAASGSAGTSVTFTLAVTNVGAPFAGANVITVTDPVPAGMTIAGATGTDWSCLPVPLTGPGSLTCTYTGSGPTDAGQPLAPITLTGTAKGDGPFENCAAVGVAPASGLQDAQLQDNKSCATVAVEKPALVCDRKTTKASGDTCVCLYQKMTRTSPTMCGCAAGSRLVAGKGCVREIACRKPAFPNKAGTACLCPQGLKARANGCVQRGPTFRLELPGLFELLPRGGGGAQPQDNGGIK